MKVKILVFCVIVLMIAAMVVPAAVEAAKVDKVEITIHFNPPSIVKGEKIVTPGGIIFRNDYVLTYALDVKVGETQTTGIAVAYSDYMENPDAQLLVYHQYIVITIDSMPGGTFEGIATLVIHDITGPATFDIKTHGLFLGTGAYEGQLINAGQDGDASTSWTGYLFE